jgi:hypothetical protein
MSCAGRRFLFSFSVSPDSSRLEPPPRPLSPIPRRRSSTLPPPLCTHAPCAARHPRRRPRPPPRSACATTTPARAHAARAPPPPAPPERLRAATTATPRHRRVLSRRSRTPCLPRSRASTPFTPQPQPIRAREVFDRLPDRDGSREEKGKGSCGQEARPQADSRREREAERAEMVAKATDEQASGRLVN